MSTDIVPCTVYSVVATTITVVAPHNLVFPITQLLHMRLPDFLRQLASNYLVRKKTPLIKREVENHFLWKHYWLRNYERVPPVDHRHRRVSNVLHVT